jgi:hypothetical protein
MDKSDLVRRCQEFADRHGWTLGEELGAGVQGIVFSVKSQAEQGRLAIKAHNQEAGYHGIFLIDVNPGNTSIAD